MSRYIDAELLKDRIKYHDNTTGCDRKLTKNEREIFAEVTIETLIEWVDRCPEADVAPVVHAHDLISRQAAIDVLEERLQANGYSNVTLVSELNRSIGYLMKLPSAQSEIIYCGECKYMMPNGKCSVFADPSIRPSASDYCSNAERRQDGRSKMDEEIKE